MTDYREIFFEARKFHLYNKVKFSCKYNNSILKIDKAQTPIS